eukprot:scaffold1201_cov125-Isochrysis_galbana.AAC.2
MSLTLCKNLPTRPPCGRRECCPNSNSLVARSHGPVTSVARAGLPHAPRIRNHPAPPVHTLSLGLRALPRRCWVRQTTPAPSASGQGEQTASGAPESREPACKPPGHRRSPCILRALLRPLSVRSRCPQPPFILRSPPPPLPKLLPLLPTHISVSRVAVFALVRLPCALANAPSLPPAARHNLGRGVMPG